MVIQLKAKEAQRSSSSISDKRVWSTISCGLMRERLTPTYFLLQWLQEMEASLAVSEPEKTVCLHAVLSTSESQVVR